MSNIIQVKRGNKSNIPTFSSGEFGFAQDTQEVYIGTGSSNIRVLTEDDLYTDSDVESYLSGGTGIDYSSGEISINNTYITEKSQDSVASALSSQFSYDDTTPLIDLPYFHNIASAGRLWGGSIVDNGDGTVTISEGAGLVKQDTVTIGDTNVPTSLHDGQGSKLSYVSWSATTVSLFADSYNFIYYSGANSQIEVTTDFYSISATRDFTVGRVYLEGTTTAISRLCGTNLWNFNRRVQFFGEERFPVERASGLILGNPSGLYISVTSGILWAELVNRFTTTSFDSSGVDTFMYWYQDGVGGFTQVTGNSEIDNSNFDDGSGTLQTLTTNRYGVHWVYISHDSYVYVVYGRGDYKENEASQADPPSIIPGRLSAYGTLIGKIIIQKNSTTLYSVESTFTTRFTSAGVTDHGDLAGLGDDDHTQYYNQTRLNSYLIGGTDINYSSGTINHADTSTQASSINSSRTYIQTVELDGRGHVTNLTTATETVTDTTYAAGNGLDLSSTTFSLGTPGTLTSSTTNSTTTSSHTHQIDTIDGGTI